MLTEYLPRFSLTLGLLIILCFFLPWVGIDCGNVTAVKFSGYDLTIGRLPIDRTTWEQMANRLESSTQSFNELYEKQHAKPQWYLSIVLLSAVGICGFSIKMLKEVNKVGVVAISLLSILGLLILIITALIDFGMDIPDSATILIRTSYQMGFYLVALFFIGAIILSFFTFLDLTKKYVKIESTTVTLKPETAPETITSLEDNSFFEDKKVELEEFDFGVKEKKSNMTMKSKTVPQGAKTCPTCGVVVSQYQTKCIKCGAKIK